MSCWSSIKFFVMLSLGFIKKCSTTSLLLSAINDWASNLNNHLCTHCIFIDFAKAFDSVPHQCLLLKLKAYGVGISMLKRFSSFLTTRQQCVVINGCASDWSIVLSGVSPVVSSPMKIFADDVAIYCPVGSTADCKIYKKIWI